MARRIDSTQILSGERLVLAVIVCVFVAARLWRLTSFGLFGDEVFVFWTSVQDWKSLFASVVGDVVHPPLFYILLKVWIIAGGQSLLWIKLLPFACSIIAVAPLLALCRELSLSLLETRLAFWLVAINGFLISHAQELRMYSLLLLLTCCSMTLFVRMMNRDIISRRAQAAIFAVNLLMVFTHYFGWIIVAVELSCLLIWKRERVRSFAIGVLVIATLFAPWAYLVSQAARVNPSRVNFIWNRPPPLSELIGFYANLNGALSYRWKLIGTALVTLLFISPVLAWLVRLLKKRAGGADDARRFAFLALFAFAPVALAFVASHLLPQPVWAFRYLIIAAPAYLILVSVAACRIRSSRIRFAVVMLIALWAGVSGFTEIIDRDKIAWEPLVNRMIEAEHERDARVYVTDANVGNTIQFYLDKAGDSRFQVIAVDDLSSPEGEHSWLALIRYKHETQPSIQSILEQRGYRVGKAIEGAAAGHKALIAPVWKSN